MPIKWAQEPTYTNVGYYGDILRHAARYRRVDTFDLTLSSYENLNFSLDPERREAWLDNHDKSMRTVEARRRYRKKRRPNQ